MCGREGGRVSQNGQHLARFGEKKGQNLKKAHFRVNGRFGENKGWIRKKCTFSGKSQIRRENGSGPEKMHIFLKKGRIGGKKGSEC